MDVDFKSLTLDAAATAKVDALLILLPEVLGKPAAPTVHGDAAQSLWTWIQKVDRSGDLQPGAGQFVVGVQGAQCAASRLMVVRCASGSPAAVRKAIAAVAAELRAPAVRKLLVFTGLLDLAPGAGRAAVLAVADATYRYTTTLSQPKPRVLSRVWIAQPQGASLSAEAREAAALLAGIEWAREWANRPPNHATPTRLADAALSLKAHPRVRVDVLGPKDVAKLGMGAFLAVAQGSEQPLRFIVLQYHGGPKGEAPQVLIGKGITFDTGGISLKPAPEMDEMKFDMGGAASVLGTFRALAELQPAVNVIGLIPACENMPDGRAVKPGDVVTSLSGQTIEILNTDAEGRLILCDALTYAQRYKPAAIIDVATLTGACVIALGHIRSGLFSNNEPLAQALQAAGDRSLDLCWRMPLDDDYAEGLKSPFADMANVAGRAGGSVSAAKFLQKFVADTPWAHLDIAGTAWKSGTAKGATGRPVGLLVTYLLAVAAQRTEKPSVQADAKRPAKAKRSVVG